MNKPRVTLAKLRRPWTIIFCECGERKVWAGDGTFPGVRFRLCPKCDAPETGEAPHAE